MSRTRCVALGEVMAAKSGSVDPLKFPDEIFDLYSIPAFDKGRPEIIAGREIGSTKQTVRPGDVLLSKIVPHIRRAWVVGKDRGRRLVASGEWIVFRNAKIDPAYLRHVLVEDSFHAKFMSTVAGVGGSLLRARPSQVANIEIPVPSLAEQKRIAAILEKADRLRRMRRFARQLSDAFLQSVFLEMFADVDRGLKHWEQFRFGEVCEISDDSVDPKGSAFADLPQISSDDIESGSGELRKLQTARQKGLISVNFLVRPSEILFSKIRPNLRKVAYPKMTALCSADIYPIRIVQPECELYYVLFYLRGDNFSSIVTRIAESRSNIPKVNRDELGELTIPVPPFPLQRKFAGIVRRFERLRAQQREAERQAEHLFQTLLHRAFSGE